MTTAEALAIADQAKPIRRQPLDKLKGNATADGMAAGVTTLAKRFDGMGHAVMDMQKRVDQIAADVEFIQNFDPGQPPRRMHS